MTAPSPAAASRSIAFYSGTRVDLIAPRKETILLADIAEVLARTDAAFADSGFYSLAQRGVILAEHLGRREGALAACYALLQDSGLALLRSVSPFAFCTDDGLPGLVRSYDQLMAAAHEALDLDWPCPGAMAGAIHQASQSLHLRELMTLRHNVDPEIARLRGAGVQPIAAHLSPIPREKAWAKWIGTWQVYAHAAQLPRTPAWQGLAR